MMLTTLLPAPGNVLLVMMNGLSVGLLSSIALYVASLTTITQDEISSYHSSNLSL